MNFYQSVIPEKPFKKTICKKVGLWDNHPSILPFLVRYITQEIILNLDYKYHKCVELQRNLNHFKFGLYFYLKHGKATLTVHNTYLDTP